MLVLTVTKERLKEHVPKRRFKIPCQHIPFSSVDTKAFIAEISKGNVFFIFVLCLMSKSRCTWCVRSTCLESTILHVSVTPGVRFFTNVIKSGIVSTSSETLRYSRSDLQDFRILRTSASSNVRSNVEVPDKIPRVKMTNFQRKFWADEKRPHFNIKPSQSIKYLTWMHHGIANDLERDV